MSVFQPNLNLSNVTPIRGAVPRYEGSNYIILAKSWNGGDANHIAAGPWGGRFGTQWDDGVHSAVRQIIIISSAGIDSIQFEYDKNNSSIWSEKHGANSGVKTDKIKLQYPNEFLISISGTYGSLNEGAPMIIRSLSFESNMRKYGPFGIQQGTPFSLPIRGGKLVGFYGRSSSHLDSIGVYLQPLLQRNNPLDLQKMTSTTPVNPFPPSSKKVMTFGPWGGDSGTIFDDGIYTGVREVHVTRSGGMVSIRVCYDQNGKVVWGSKHGGTAGLKLDKIVFDYPFEFLTHITGYYGSTILRGPTIIKSITFHTTKRSYGPFGDQQGFSFSSGSRDGAIVGFHGRKGYFINSIGVHVLEGIPLLSQHSYPDPFDMSTLKSNEVVAWGVPKEPSLYETGPWGGEGGAPWDDGVYKGVKRIILTRGDTIRSIQIGYDSNGQLVWSPPHGIPNDACTYQVKFDYPHEILTCISGYYDTLAGNQHQMVIRSLTFHTNKAKYGPYGRTIGTYFSSANKDGKVVGFHGRSGCFLDAIGVHMQYWMSDEISNRYPPEKGTIMTMLHKLTH